MMQYEFEKLAQREVTTRQYEAFEMLYNESNLDKVDFVESVRRLLEHLPEPPKYRQIVYVVLADRITGDVARGKHGGTLAIMAEITQIDIKTGEITLRYSTSNENLIEIDRLPQERVLYSDDPRLKMQDPKTWRVYSEDFK